jgi:D-alanyl-D-alanine carboxypeptidase (penicillin-binding protein 5/6)
MTLACVFQAMQEPVSYNLNSNIKIPNNIKRFESDLIGFDGKDSKGNPVRNGHTGKGLLPGEEYKMRDLLIGVGAKSDVRSTYAIALSVAKVYGWEGSEDQILARFVQLMNQTALNIGMHNTYFSNPAGESVNGNQSTAHDIARLVSYIQIEFPELIEHACGTPYPNLGILSDSRRHSSRALRARHDQIQWAKTGYTGVSGFSETAHIKIGEQSFIAVLFGAKSSTDRKNQMLGLVDKAVEYASKTSPTISTRNAPTPSAAPKTSPRPQLRPSR